MTNLKDKQVAVLGLGQENIPLVKYLVTEGAQVTVCDKQTKEELAGSLELIKDFSIKEYRLGDAYLDNLEGFDTIFRSPGIPYLNEKIQQAKSRGVEVTSQTKLFFDLCPGKIIGVTGTKGKGTTATLIYEILKSHISNITSRVYLAGNIGQPPIELINQLTADSLVILELSSFQLQDLNCSPNIAVVLDIKSDHLDVHQAREEYVDAKKNIVRYQKENDIAIINADYETSADFTNSTKAQVYLFSREKEVTKGAYVNDKEEIILADDGETTKIIETSELILRGKHNWENVCAAVTVSRVLGVEVGTIATVVKSFKGLEHRLEFVKNVNGVGYYNDSFSTTPDTTIAAIKSFSEPTILLVGGSDKGADYSELANVISDSTVKTIVNIGLTGGKIIKKITNPKIKIYEQTQTLKDALKLIQEMSEPGDVVILSPASASFDRYKNYKHRGEEFKKEVHLL